MVNKKENEDENKKQITDTIKLDLGLDMDKNNLIYVFFKVVEKE